MAEFIVQEENEDFCGFIFPSIKRLQLLLLHWLKIQPFSVKPLCLSGSCTQFTNGFNKNSENEIGQTLMLSLDKMVPSATVGGASKEEGLSCSVIGDAGMGLVGVVVDDGVTGGDTGVEPAEDRGKEG